MSDAFPGRERSRHMGELKRGPNRWDVYLEIAPDADLGAVRGRIHFVRTAEPSHKATGWVFLEWEERDILERFGEFSAVELLQFVEAIQS